ncbi:MAG: LUD domain-containing protein [Anaerolineales bacterium]|nr:LUD domain-containing protein [Anaerolineales bacterium]MCS7247020.1 LUD domain-containing protein [Anaerolineales bacterium]MDW8160831.1 LUD domain-containing protein [Anaerolineales bacterium]MDW8446813.1 LUD domain-containing protein [Anaerolineales bacterium]
MPSNFHQRIRHALADPILQAALDNNAERRNTARRTIYQSLPQDLQTLRQRAHAVRAEVIRHLDRYLAEFITNVQHNGWMVHRADTAHQAVETILRIAQSHHAKRIAKSKSMVSEEIELNSALQKAGIEVVETDLGEYIVQLRQEPPAHIITPAVHLTRQQVGQLFHEKLGAPLTDDVPTMTETVRRALREVFLTAEIGLSGVNFGVVENGVICIVTNEGNGRMVTTLPPVHIALMGIERLVPTVDDLALMLYLLPRSATGQKLTVYTSLIRSPFREGGDGCRERHLILVDNGRSALRGSPLEEALYCIRCGACFNACPVFREIGGHSYIGSSGKHTPYGGPIGSVISPALFGYREFGHLARASSLCGACREACPVDIDLPKLLLRVRSGNLSTASKFSPRKPNTPSLLKWGINFFTLIATSPTLFRFAQQTAGILSRIISPSRRWLRLPSLTGWGYSKDFPTPAHKPFRATWREIRQEVTSSPIDLHSVYPNTKPPLHSKQPSSPQSFVEQFESELTSLGGKFVPCSSTDVTVKVLSFLKEENISAVQAWSQEFLPAGLLALLQESGIQVTSQPHPDLLAGITSAECAIAESGTLVIPGDLKRPLTTSLLPDIHLAILRKSDILPRLPEALHRQERLKTPVTVLISGPSRTADIEMSLTIGVHGPKRVIVFCLMDA